MVNEYDNNELKVNLTRGHFKKNTYWTMCKFLSDDYTIENASSKRSLVGDFIDRWTNKAPETLIFNEILKDKDYDIVKDTFIYTSSKAKNAPDILGLIDEEGNVFPFSKFNGESWESNFGPVVEMKTFRDSQKLITIPDSQFDPESFFVIVESHIPKDYLLSLFNKDFFDDENLILMEDYYKHFIIPDEQDILNIPTKIESSFISSDESTIGYYKLIGIYKGKDLENLGKIVKKGESPCYFSGIGEPAKRKDSRYDINPSISIPQGEFFFKNDMNNLPCQIKIHDNSKIDIIRENKNAIDVCVKGVVKIDDELLNEGTYRLNFPNFSKDGEYAEYITTKSLLRLNHEKISAIEELLDIFDGIVIR